MNSIDNLSIDIILPNYNKGEYIDECILSILNQSFLNWKLYIIETINFCYFDDFSGFGVIFPRFSLGEIPGEAILGPGSGN